MKNHRGSVRADRVDFSVIWLRVVVEPGGVFVPLALGNDVAQLIVTQAQDELVFALQQSSKRGLHGSVGKIGAGVACNTAIDQLRENLTWHRDELRDDPRSHF